MNYSLGKCGDSVMRCRAYAIVHIAVGRLEKYEQKSKEKEVLWERMGVLWKDLSAIYYIYYHFTCSLKKIAYELYLSLINKGFTIYLITQKIIHNALML